MIKSRRMRWAGYLARMGYVRNSYKILVRKREGTRPRRGHKRGWEDIKMDIREVGFEGMDWINLAQDRDRCRAVVNTVMNLRVPNKSGNFLAR
jgi:hypothetical protein